MDNKLILPTHSTARAGKEINKNYNSTSDWIKEANKNGPVAA